MIGTYNPNMVVSIFFSIFPIQPQHIPYNPILWWLVLLEVPEEEPLDMEPEIPLPMQASHLLTTYGA